MWHNLPFGWATPWFRYGVACPSSLAREFGQKEPGPGTQGG